MNNNQVYEKFPTQDSCIEYLENIRWNNIPVCPYCKSTNHTAEKNKHRYHCNNCNTSYSVTVGTIFHHTHLDLQKWFLAIYLVLNTNKVYSVRQLSEDLSVTKDTAWRMLTRLKNALIEDHVFLEKVFKKINSIDSIPSDITR